MNERREDQKPPCFQTEKYDCNSARCLECELELLCAGDDGGCSGNYLGSAHSYREGFFCTICGENAPDSLDRPHRPCACPDCSSDEKSAGEKAFDDIAALCGCPEWDYPGQLVRDVEALVASRQAMRRILGERRKVLLDRSKRRFPTDRAELVAIDVVLKQG